MTERRKGRVAGLAAILTCLSGAVWTVPAAADHLVARTIEQRTVLYFKVPEAVLERRLPAGWHPVDFDAGPAKGANLTVNFSDELLAIGPDGTASDEKRGHGVTLSARVRDPVSGQPRAMVLFGVTDGPDAPGPYGTHVAAEINLTRLSMGVEDGTRVEESWRASNPAGDRIALDITFARGAMVASHLEQQTRSGPHPDFFRIYKMDLVSDTVRSEDRHLDSAKRLSFSVAGRPRDILDGTERLMAIVSVPSYRREIWLPDGN
jgi:hypothetical protein